LRDKNLAEGIYTEVVSSFKTLIDLMSIEITLTHEGFKNYLHVLSIVDLYI